MGQKRLTTQELRSRVAELSAAGAPARALALLAQRVQSDPPLFEYPWLAQELGRRVPTPVEVRVGILSTFTIDNIRDGLRAHGLAQGLALDLYFGGFQQLEQEVMSPASGLVQHNPAVVILACDLRDLSPPLYERFLDLTPAQVTEHVNALLGRLRGIVEHCRRNLPRAAIVMHALLPPRHAALGVLDFTHAAGQQRAVDALNAGLREIARLESTYVLDCDALARRSGAAWNSVRHYLTARAPLGPEALVELAREYVKLARAVAGKTKKALICDIDNTLWGGILGEDGLSGVKLGPDYPGNAYRAFQQEIRQLGRRGVVLALNSKNNEDQVREAFEKHPHMVLRWDDFAAARVNWQDKALNLRELADQLSLSLNSFVFVDDNPVEIEIVQQQLPEVATVLLPEEPAELPGLLARLGWFDSVIFSDEDRRRGDFYRAEAQRTQLEQSSTDLETFYRTLAMQLVRQRVGDGEIPRVAQLTQRTNQFNMTTRRYSEADIRRLCDSREHRVYAYGLKDAFGDNGVIGAVIAAANGRTWQIDTFLMSCRVIGRTVEDSIVALLAQEAQAAGATALEGEFIPTKANAPARGAYERMGFRKVDESEARQVWRLEFGSAAPRVPEWIQVVEKD